MKYRNIFLFALTFPLLAQAAGKDLQYSTTCDVRNKQATIAMVGDVLIHKALYEEVLATSQHFSQIWQRTTAAIQKADFSVANLEGPAALGIDDHGRDHGDVGFIYDGSIYSGTNMRFNYHPRILSDLKNSGFDLLTSANNHVLDRGALGIDRTLQAAEEINMPLIGIHSAADRSGSFYEIVSIRDLRVAFLGCTEMTNGFPDRQDQVLHCYQGTQVEDIVKELHARSDVDAVIVYPHWGQEYQKTPRTEQVSFGHRWLEAGAIAVVGSHPHVLQPWEKYVTKDGRETLVIYSLGNFVAYQAGIEKKSAVIAYLGLSREGDGKAKIFGVAYTPTYRDGFVNYPVSDRSQDVLNEVAKNFGTVNRLSADGNLNAKLCP